MTLLFTTDDGDFEGIKGFAVMRRWHWQRFLFLTRRQGDTKAGALTMTQNIFFSRECANVANEIQIIRIKKIWSAAALIRDIRVFAAKKKIIGAVVHPLPVLVLRVMPLAPAFVSSCEK
jgi:hypothetical protein